MTCAMRSHIKKPLHDSSYRGFENTILFFCKCCVIYNLGIAPYLPEECHITCGAILKSILLIFSRPKKSLSCIFASVSYFLFIMASIDFMQALLMPDSSSDATPQIVVPDGEHTLSFRTPGCSPVSS